MGMYTEFVFGASLKKDTPKHIVEILKVIFNISKRLPEKYADQQGKIPDIGGIPFCCSFYFGDHRSHSMMYFDDISNAWALSIRCSIKNYDDEIQKFVDWILPYVDSGSGVKEMIGYSIYEEGELPILYFKDGTKMVLIS